MLPVEVLGDDDTRQAAILGCQAADESSCTGLHEDHLHRVWWTDDHELAKRILELLKREVADAP